MTLPPAYPITLPMHSNGNTIVLPPSKKLFLFLAMSLRALCLHIILTLSLIATSCQKPKPIFDSGKPLKVLVTTSMIADMVRSIAKERISLYQMMGPKVDPHSYQVTYPDTLALQQADIIFYNGEHLEGKMQDVLEHRQSTKGNTWAISSSISENQLIRPQANFAGHHDPHIWGNPRIWINGIKLVVDKLSETDPAGASFYQKNGEAYRKQIQALDTWVTQRIQEIPANSRALVTSHDAFSYFGKAYGIEVRGLQGVSTNSEAGLKDRKHLIAFIKSRQIKMIFPESSVNAKGIASIAHEAHVAISKQTLFSDATGKPGDIATVNGESYDKGTYVGMIKHNVNTIVNGLK